VWHSDTQRDFAVHPQTIRLSASDSIQTCMDDQPETVESEKEKARAKKLAHLLVEEAWNLGADPMVLTVQYEGAIWEVSVKVVQSEG
jgi:hypothetical protein